jgi:hypothetical protein
MQVIMQLFHWTRNPSQAHKIMQRKEEIYDSIMNGTQPAEVPGSRGFLDTLRNYNVSFTLQFTLMFWAWTLLQCVRVCVFCTGSVMVAAIVRQCKPEAKQLKEGLHPRTCI